MPCPNCGGEVWENAEKVATGWKGPLRKCKAECGFIVWPPKSKGQAPVTKSVSTPREAKWTWPTLSATYHQSLLIARKQVIAMATATKLPVTVADVLSAAATIFIAASRYGVKDITPVQEPAPQPQPADEYAF